MGDMPLIARNDAGLPAKVALTAGDIIKVVTESGALKYDKTAGEDDVDWFVAFTDAAIGDIVTGLKARKMAVKVKAFNNTTADAIAVGDELYIDDGLLNVDATSNTKAEALAAEAVAAGVTTVAEVFVYRLT